MKKGKCEIEKGSTSAADFSCQLICPNAKRPSSELFEGPHVFQCIRENCSSLEKVIFKFLDLYSASVWCRK
jgi:hypothetical protein